MKIDLVNLIPILSLFSVVLFSVLLLVLKKKQESNRYFIFHIANLGFIVFFFLLAQFWGSMGQILHTSPEHFRSVDRTFYVEVY